MMGWWVAWWVAWWVMVTGLEYAVTADDEGSRGWDGPEGGKIGCPHNL